MYTESFEQWYKMNKNLFNPNPVNDLNRHTTEMWHRITQQNLEMVGETVTRLTEQLNRLSHIKKPEDALKLQSECLQENIQASMDSAQKILSATMKNMEECTKLCESFLQTCQSSEKTEKERQDKSDR